MKQMLERSLEINSRLIETNSQLIEQNAKLAVALNEREQQEEEERKEKLRAYSFIFDTDNWKEYRAYFDKTADTPAKDFHEFIIDKLARDLQAMEKAS